MLGSKRENRSESTEEPAARPKKLASHELCDRYRPLDVEMTSLLHGVVGRFGHPATEEGGQYILSIDFAEALEDLIQFLSADEGPLMIKLCEMQAVQRHLVPMLVVISRKRFPNALFSLLNILTLLTCGEIEANRASHEALLDCRRQYKKCFERKCIMEALLVLAVSCVMPRPETAAEDAEMLGKVLMLLKNLVAIPDASVAYMSANISLASSFGKHERLLIAMRNARLLEFLMIAGASCNDPRDKKVFGPHVSVLVEIFACILRVADPDEIAGMHDFDPAGPQKSLVEQAVQDEKKIQRPIRHSRFSGSVVVRLSTGEDYMLAASKMKDAVTLDAGKRVQHRPKRYNINNFGDDSGALRSGDKLEIYNMSLQFVREAFGELVKHCMERNSLAGPDDNLDWNLFGLVAWSLRFARQLFLAKSKELPMQCLYSALDGESLVRWGRSLRRLLNEKNYGNVLAGIILFREALRFLDLMHHSKDPQAVQDAKNIERSMFYHQDVIVIFKMILQSSQRFSLKMLSVLVEANHVLLKLLKSFCAEKSHVFMLPTRRAAASPVGDEEDEGNDDEGVSRAEKEFFFDELLSEYASEAVLDAYIRLLRKATDLDPNTNRFVATMLIRISKELKAPMLLYRVSVLDALYRIITHHDPGWRRNNAEIVKVASAISQAFLQELKDDPTVIVSAFFSAHTVYGIRRGKERSRLHEGASPEAPLALDTPPMPTGWTRSERVAWLIRTLVEAEQSSAVSWLVGKLFDAAASRSHAPNDEDSEGRSGGADHFLLAHTDSLKAAFSTPQFRALLLEAMVTPPSTHKDSWTIAGSISADSLLGVASAIQGALRLSIEQAEGEGGHKDEARGVVDQEAISPIPASIRNQRRVAGSRGTYGAMDRESDSISSDNHSEEEEESVPAVTPIQSRWESLKRSNFFLATAPTLSDDDDDDDGKKSESVSRLKRPPLVIDSEDEGKD